jgi:microcystin-dependent protein
MTPFVGQLMLASFNFAPRNWLPCNGQTLPISSYQPLFSLLGTFYGGNGVNNFMLPNLQGATPIGFGNSSSGNYNIGQAGGEAGHILQTTEVPSHTHQLNAASSGGSTIDPGRALPAGQGPNIFVAPGSNINMNAATLPAFGGGQAHENRQPFLVMNWCISLSGIFPSRS